jgi:hypothetical protein
VAPQVKITQPENQAGISVQTGILTLRSVVIQSVIRAAIQAAPSPSVEMTALISLFAIDG